MDVFASDDIGIDCGREQEEYSTWATLESNSKKFVKLFNFKCILKRHGFLQDYLMDRPRKIYLIEASYLDYDTKRLEEFIIPLSKNDVVSAESLKVELEKVSQANDGKPPFLIRKMWYQILTYFYFIFLVSILDLHKQVMKCKLHAKLTSAFQQYDKVNCNSNEISIVSNGRGFQQVRGLNKKLYIVSELQALACEGDQESVDKIPLVYLPKKHLNQKVSKENLRF